MRAKKILILSMALVVFISQSSLASEIDDLLAPVNLKAQRHENEDNKYSNRKRTKPHVITSGKSSDKDELYKSFDDGANGEKGYLKNTFSKGGRGYKNHDTFQKKLGDKYRFEEHRSFEKPEIKKGRKIADDHEQAGTDIESYYDDGESFAITDNDDDEAGDASNNNGSADYYETDGDGSYEAFSAEDGSYY